MERLTEAWGTNHFAIKGNATVYSRNPKESQRVACALAKLFSYEDTGLEPEEIRKWIPVTERLPEDYEVVHVTVRHGYVDAGYYDCSKKEWWTTDDAELLDVIAWMPEPEPFVPPNGVLRKE